MEQPAVVLCSTRGGLAQRLPSLLGMGGLDLLKVDSAEALRRLARERLVQLFLLDVHDPELPLDALVDALASPGPQRLIPVLIVGRGAAAQDVAVRLRGHFAVRTVDMETGDGPAGPGSLLRRHRRVPLRIPVYAAGMVGPLGQSHDLSEEGLGVVARFSARPGESFLVRFVLPDGKGDFQAEAEVRRAAVLAGGGVFLGLWFRGASAAGRDRLRDFVDSLATADGEGADAKDGSPGHLGGRPLA